MSSDREMVTEGEGSRGDATPPGRWVAGSAIRLYAVYMLKPVNVPQDVYLHGADSAVVAQVIREMEIGATYTFADLFARYRELAETPANAISVARALGGFEGMERGRMSVEGRQARVWTRTK